ncbi:hypothetical protein N7530_008982 [Penicillium desertorum]|uniref:Uncharacterized protein n=1 Tax=Penicillium desertorum TaxID=1303715 RepID=A0A9W9WQ47_9EURO|nr:hypothetical protein N7530_008982 [Penicillium desertorum]
MAGEEVTKSLEENTLTAKIEIGDSPEHFEISWAMLDEADKMAHKWNLTNLNQVEDGGLLVMQEPILKADDEYPLESRLTEKLSKASEIPNR